MPQGGPGLPVRLVPKPGPVHPAAALPRSREPVAGAVGCKQQVHQPPHHRGKPWSSGPLQMAEPCPAMAGAPASHLPPWCRAPHWLPQLAGSILIFLPSSPGNGGFGPGMFPLPRKVENREALHCPVGVSLRTVSKMTRSPGHSPFASKNLGDEAVKLHQGQPRAEAAWGSRAQRPAPGRWRRWQR